MTDRLSSDLQSGALIYHSHPRPGKLEIRATKPLGNQRDLALAYSPGVAAPCLAIAADPARAAEFTIRQNLVAVITNGTAVLGLGDIGPLAAKPVMEGKAVLFKKFAGIDVFDIEIAETRRRKAGRGHRRAGADLRRHQSRRHQGAGMFRGRAHAARANVDPGVSRRPARHRDHRRRRGAQRAWRWPARSIEDVRIVTSGAGAAALACLDLLVALGARRENIFVTDLEGVVYKGRNELMDPLKETLCAGHQRPGRWRK